jgi:hypothetical protein
LFPFCKKNQAYLSVFPTSECQRSAPAMQLLPWRIALAMVRPDDRRGFQHDRTNQPHRRTLRRAAGRAPQLSSGPLRGAPFSPFA